MPYLGVAFAHYALHTTSSQPDVTLRYVTLLCLTLPYLAHYALHTTSSQPAVLTHVATLDNNKCALHTTSSPPTPKP